MKAVAKLKNCSGSPRKMRLVIDAIRGMEVDMALRILKVTSKKSSNYVEKLLLSAVSNWQSKNEGIRVEDAGLYVKEVFVDGGRVLKRWRPAPRGSAHRIRKRTNHVTIVIDNKRELEKTVAIKKEKSKKEKTTDNK